MKRVKCTECKIGSVVIDEAFDADRAYTDDIVERCTNPKCGYWARWSKCGDRGIIGGKIC
ncbi:hypothetical protein M0R19_05680 [Candidatus Pacearchaeota archaeon]|nr:hypothetical protein [Candidatus Pacearchaeota archaeon]